MTAVKTGPAQAGAGLPPEDAPGTVAAFAEMAELPDSSPRKETLRQLVVCAWMPMALRLARRFRDRGEPLEDLQQVAALGLTKAVRHFDLQRGTPFVAFAIPTIVGELKRHFRDHAWGTHVPRRVQELRNRVRRAQSELAESPQARPPTVSRIAAHTGLSEADVAQGMEALHCYAPLSLEADLASGENGYRLADVLGGADTRFDRIIDRETLRPEIARLSDRERQLLYLRFFCNLTQHRIAEQLGLSQMQVSRLLQRTCATLRERITAVSPDP